MRSIAPIALRVASAVVVLGLLVPTVLGHGGDEAMSMEMGSDMTIGVTAPPPELDLSPSYIAHPEHGSILLAHIGLMLLAWVFVLPLGKCVVDGGSPNGLCAWFRADRA